MNTIEKAEQINTLLNLVKGQELDNNKELIKELAEQRLDLLLNNSTENEKVSSSLTVITDKTKELISTFARVEEVVETMLTNVLEIATKNTDNQPTPIQKEEYKKEQKAEQINERSSEFGFTQDYFEED